MYGSSKAALEHMTLDLAEAVRASGVTVAALAPSMVVPTPGATATNFGGEGLDPDRVEPMEYMVHAAVLLATEPLERVSGRVVYSQQLLKEYGLLDHARGTGVDRAGSGFSQLNLHASTAR
jgi:NAD(P)-dependent dehydrogenase (short-subunit alcohol dehydrogenase family)